MEKHETLFPLCALMKARDVCEAGLRAFTVKECFDGSELYILIGTYAFFLIIDSQPIDQLLSILLFAP